MDESAALTTDLEYPRSINFEARKERVPRDVATDVDPLSARIISPSATAFQVWWGWEDLGEMYWNLFVCLKLILDLIALSRMLSLRSNMIISTLLVSYVNLTGQFVRMGSSVISLILSSTVTAKRSSIYLFAIREEVKKVERWYRSIRNMKMFA